MKIVKVSYTDQSFDITYPLCLMTRQRISVTIQREKSSSPSRLFISLITVTQTTASHGE